MTLSGPPLVDRIPADQPFVLEIRRGRRYLLSLAGAVVGIGIAFGTMGLLLDGYGFILLSALAGCIGSAVGWAVVVAIQQPRNFAADRDGVWVLLPEHRPRALWLPWTAVDRVYTDRRWYTGHYLAIVPRDPRTGKGLGVDRVLCRRRRRNGAPFLAPLRACGSSPDRALAAVRELAPGSCRIG